MVVEACLEARGRGGVVYVNESITHSNLLPSAASESNKIIMCELV